MRLFHAIRLCFLLVTAGVPLSVSASELDPVEQAVVEWVGVHKERALQDLEALLAIDSPTENHAGQRAAANFFAERFAAMGFVTRWTDMREVTGRAGHFEAEIQGDEGRRILLLGHLDTVLPSTQVYREDGRLYGSGAGDMKGGNMVILAALQALSQAGALQGRRILVHFTGDEEEAGEPIDAARAAMREAARRSDVVLSFEGGDGKRAVVARRSSSDWKLIVESPSGHSSRIFSDGLGFGANYELARIVNEFREQLAGEEYLTFNVALMAGGKEASVDEPDATAWGKGNIVPAVAQARGDLRVLSLEQMDRVVTRMTAIVESGNLPRTSAQITFEHRYPPMSPTPENDELLDMLSQVSQDLGYGAVEAHDPGARGAGDISFVAPILPGLDGLGVNGKNAHAEGEYMLIDSFAPQIERAALLIYRLTR
jgi:glutamate carboxypeptidase